MECQRGHFAYLGKNFGPGTIVITDPLPRSPSLRKQYEASDARLTLALPNAEIFQAAARALAEALAVGRPAGVKRAGLALLQLLAERYQVSRPGLSVLGMRPQTVVEGQYSMELFGDYTPSTKKIRVWMRTAVLGKVTSFRGLLNTLLHEFCHHLDVEALGLPDTPHTRGFYHRIDGLYHLALGTPQEERRELRWIRTGASWRVDWNRLRRRR
jgi:hypothetical protein